jgi:hypothetical protein
MTSPHISEMTSRDQPVAENMPHQRRVWIAERIGWAVVTLIVVLALAGVFGRGPLSAMTVASGDGSLTVEADRFQRNGARSMIRVAALVPAGESAVSIRISREFFEHFNIEAMVPQAATAAPDGAGVQLSFPARGGDRAVVYLRVRAEGIGLMRSRIALSGGGSVDLLQFIHP